MVADMEAGLEHLSWAGGTLRHAEMLLIAVQSTARALLTAERTYTLAAELGIPDIAFVATRAASGDLDQLAAFAAERGRELIAVIPEDEAVAEADRMGRCLLDTAPGSPCAQVIDNLADQIETRGAHPAG